MSTSSDHDPTGNPPSSALPVADRVPSRYWIPPHVRICVTGTGTVILDLKRNRYFGIGVKESRALLALDERGGRANVLISTSLEPMTPESAARMAPALEDAELLTRRASRLDLLPPPPADVVGTLTTVELRLDNSITLRLSDGIRFLRACLWARQATRVRMLYDVACEIAEQKQHSSALFEMDRTIDRVSLFRRLRPFAFTPKDRCLFHALALWKFLSYYQLYATWVIGVRPRPWAAHSWIQAGSVLLDADPEHVYEYFPILAV